MPIPANATFHQVTQWLELNLDDLKRISANHTQTRLVPQTKGIYFWFMKKEGYLKLSKFMNISPLPNIYSRQINNETYDLVYLGTAGTGKKGNSNLQERLQWHIEQKHRESAINQENSALSTLRTGMGALLANDLILPNTEQLINSFFEKYMLVYWVGYSGNKKEIDSDRIHNIFHIMMACFGIHRGWETGIIAFYCSDGISRTTRDKKHGFE
jgi:hypothetical protein